MVWPRAFYRLMAWLMFHLGHYGPSVALLVLDYAWWFIGAFAAGLLLVLVVLAYGVKVALYGVLLFVVYTLVVLAAAQFMGNGLGRHE